MRRLLALSAGGAIVLQWAPAVAAVEPRAAGLFDIPSTTASPDGVLLTFDDGPHPQGTPAVLSMLERIRAPSVFFVSGEQALRHPELVREIASAGHELGLHGHRHQSRRQWTPRGLAEDTRRALDAVARAVDTRPRLYRPPHGVFSLTGLRVVRVLGLEPLLWSRWGRDWERHATSSTIASRATNGIRAGDIVLLHDADHYGADGSWRATAAALPSIADAVTAAGLRFVPAWNERLVPRGRSSAPDRVGSPPQ